MNRVVVNFRATWCRPRIVAKHSGPLTVEQLRSCVAKVTVK
ncbi:MAG: hypothetical protein QOI24_4051 [Acidobacteriota bacterium]|jgi:hypothetical protein|nr:hypothetical protein [Acidobacteriota bacterium]